ncbi:MAG: ATP-binding cassette domain-containing protein, partial [Thermoplasmata archaeon]|nr:ATP-binding cassette domain-containing protein [Thermoplasmata archaeon]
MANAIIEVKDLEHSFGDVKAVDKVSFTVEEGEIFSFLGPNGAGKSTTINVLTTQLPCQNGTAHVCGFDVRTNRQSVKRSIGIVFQDEVLDRDMTVRETLEFHGRIYSMPRAERLGREKELIELVELEQKVNVRTKHLSGGMKRRLEIARGLMTRPRVLFLDEPTIGLDPQTRLKIWDYIKGINEEGTTIFLTTHYMDEADTLSDRIEIIDHGKIIATGTSESLKNILGKDMIYLETEDDSKAADIARAMVDVTEVKKTSKGLELILNADGNKVMPAILRHIGDEGIDILSVKMKKP